MMVPIADPQLGEIEEKLVLEVLRSGRLAQGEMVERFEEAVAEVVGVEHAIAVNNGTSALIAAMVAAGIGPGDEVITTPLTFIATLNAILFVGATPRFADVGDDFNIDPESVSALINQRTRAMVPVHLYGRLARMDELSAIADAHGIDIIEDAAQALGARSPSGAAGQFGLGCFSFYATKNVTTGEGGLVTTNSADQAMTLRRIRNQGQAARYEYVMAGYNLRMTELDAAVGVGQMSRFSDIVHRRRENARELAKGLKGIEGLVIPSEPPGHVHVFNQFTVRVERHARIGRDELQRRLAEAGVSSQIYYPKLVFEYDYAPKPIDTGLEHSARAQRFTREVLSLPVHPGVENAHIDRIVETVRRSLD
jgi:dTDP-4-amino-4,6-dideoxygalactose transaminase